MTCVHIYLYCFFFTQTPYADLLCSTEKVHLHVTALAVERRGPVAAAATVNGVVYNEVDSSQLYGNQLM